MKKMDISQEQIELVRDHVNKAASFRPRYLEKSTTHHIEVGDQVFFGKFAGTEIEIEGEKLVIVKEDELLGFVKVSDEKWNEIDQKVAEVRKATGWKQGMNSKTQKN